MNMATTRYLADNLHKIVAERRLPGLTFWNRLEGRPRADNFERAMRAEVRDPLWMLTKQWQMGEFQGDDAGSAIAVKMRVETTRLRRFKAADGPVEPFTDAMPLEAIVEHMPVAFSQRQVFRDPVSGTQKVSHLDVALDIRLLMGRQWLKMIRPISAAAVNQFIKTYPVHAPDSKKPEDFAICAHPEAWANFRAAGGLRMMDGFKLYDHLTTSSANHATDGIAALAGQNAVVDLVAKRFVAWFDKLVFQPDAAPARSSWLPDRLEYQFAASAPMQSGEKVFLAEQYAQGHLDWYNFDIDPKKKALNPRDPAPGKPERITLSMLPTQVTFNGMPNTRWWRFEESRTSFADIKPDTTDLAKLMLIEFGLVYANDWLKVPVTVPAGSVTKVLGAAVTNVFGERVWVEPAGQGDDDDWQRWAMFLVSIAGKGHETADTSLMVPPVAQQVLEGKAHSDILMARDEMANMVWAVERGIELPSGEPKNGREAAGETRAFFARDLESRLGAPPKPPPAAKDAKIRYRVMTSVPENWVPLIPVHVSGDMREVQLQRASMPRVMAGDTAPPEPVKPRTTLMRFGLDQDAPESYAIHEEEVPRAGAVLTQSYQRTRWTDGRVWLWLGCRKKTGRGESSSGLAFDQIIDLPPKV
jgi:hypothetical protein